jgi:hypothetical protein
MAFFHDATDWRQVFPNISGGTSFFIGPLAPGAKAKAAPAATLAYPVVIPLGSLALGGKAKSAPAATIGLASPAFTVLNPLGFHTSTYTATSTVSTTISIVFNTNGTWSIQSNVGGALASGNWGTPTTTGIGSNYWIRYTRIFLNATNGGFASSSSGWINMSVATSVAAVSADFAGGSTANSIFQIEISTNAGGTNIVSASQVGLVATRSATAVITAPDGQLEAYGIGQFGSATASLRLNIDGTNTFGSTPVIVGLSNNWYTPTTAGAGNGYNVYAELVSGQTPTAGSDALNTWLPLSTARNFLMARQNVGLRQGQLRFYIGDTNLNILSTGMVNFIAQVDSDI